MENSRKARENAEAALAGPPEQPAKGSAIGMIAAENLAVQEKTARLKKMRLERDAADLKAAPKAAATAKAKAGAKTAAKPKKATPKAAAKAAPKASAGSKAKKISRTASGRESSKAAEPRTKASQAIAASGAAAD